MIVEEKRDKAFYKATALGSATKKILGQKAGKILTKGNDVWKYIRNKKK